MREIKYPMLNQRTLFSVVVIFLFLLQTRWSYAQFRSSDRPKLVEVQTLEFEYETSLIEAVGTAQAKRSVTLFPSVAEEVTAIHFEPGQSVKKGDVLVELDSRLQDVAIKRARIQLNDAKRNYSRAQSSQKSGAVTQSEVDAAQTLFLLAEVALEEAIQNKEDRLIRAPFDGTVGLTDIEVGDRVDVQTQVTTLDDRSALLVNFVAPELAVNYLLTKPEVMLQPWTDRSTQFNAAITEVDSRVSVTDRTMRVRALMDNANDIYRPGMSFRVALEVKGERYISIPEVALSWSATGAYVWLAEGTEARKVNVQVKQRLRGRILVSGDLRDAELLVVEGVQGLREGQTLKFQNPQAYAASPSSTTTGSAK